MTTWRERIAEARERKRQGHRGFTADDMETWASCPRCFVGETVTTIFGVDADGTALAGYPVWKYEAVSSMYRGTPRALQGRIYDALSTDDVDAAERLLDAIEDRALEIKREGGSR